MLQNSILVETISNTCKPKANIIETDIRLLKDHSHTDGLLRTSGTEEHLQASFHAWMPATYKREGV